MYLNIYMYIPNQYRYGIICYESKPVLFMKFREIISSANLDEMLQ